jgi:hypothetical protein
LFLTDQISGGNLLSASARKAKSQLSDLSDISSYLLEALPALAEGENLKRLVPVMQALVDGGVKTWADCMKCPDSVWAGVPMGVKKEIISEATKRTAGLSSTGALEFSFV